MTTISEASDAVVKHFLAGWGDRSPVILDNEAEGQPDQNWVRLTVRHRGAGQETLGRPGNRRFERRAAAYVQLFLAQDAGRKLADEWTQAVLDIFEGVSLAGTSVHFGDVIPRERGPDGKWYGVTVEATFTYDETK